jgi:hypothetical protein
MEQEAASFINSFSLLATIVRHRIGSNVEEDWLAEAGLIHICIYDKKSPSKPKLLLSL